MRKSLHKQILRNTMKALTEKEGMRVKDRQNESILIVLPLDGEIVAIDQVPDPIFPEK